MAIKTKEELLTSFKNALGDNTDDATLSLFEDFTDTYDKMDNDLEDFDSDEFDDLDIEYSHDLEDFGIDELDERTKDQLKNIARKSEDILRDSD